MKAITDYDLTELRQKEEEALTEMRATQQSLSILRKNLEIQQKKYAIISSTYLMMKNLASQQ